MEICAFLQEMLQSTAYIRTIRAEIIKAAADVHFEFGQLALQGSSSSDDTVHLSTVSSKKTVAVSQFIC